MGSLRRRWSLKSGKVRRRSEWWCGNAQLTIEASAIKFMIENILLFLRSGWWRGNMCLKLPGVMGILWHLLLLLTEAISLIQLPPGGRSLPPKALKTTHFHTAALNRLLPRGVVRLAVPDVSICSAPMAV